jgi:hypothetical protein
MEIDSVIAAENPVASRALGAAVGDHAEDVDQAVLDLYRARTT